MIGTFLDMTMSQVGAKEVDEKLETGVTGLWVAITTSDCITWVVLRFST